MGWDWSSAAKFGVSVPAPPKPVANYAPAKRAGTVLYVAVMNGASDFFVDVFGDAGKHARTAAGVSGPPLKYTTSVYRIAEVE